VLVWPTATKNRPHHGDALRRGHARSACRLRGVSRLRTSPRHTEQIVALFADVQRKQAETQSSIDLLRDALKAMPARGIGDNQGPRLEDLDEIDNHLLALLKDQGPRPPPAERPLIIERAEEGLRWADRIKAWLATLAEEGAKLGAREVAKDLTKPLWADVAHKVADLCHSVIAWIHALGTLL
jgi:hypothetical protein